MAASAALLVALAHLFPYPSARLGYGDLASTRLTDRHGHLLAEQRGASGVFMRPVDLDAIAPAVVLVTVASEDGGFYRHLGIDPVGVVRAIGLNASAGRFAYGGSTITQQLAKCLHPQPRTLPGKLWEAWDAWRLEVGLGKREILTQYLNRVHYGRLAVGIEAAAWRYFDKPARDLGLDEAALLAVLPRAPSYYDPDRHPERALARRAHVLRRMAARGLISRDDAERAAAAPLRLAPLRAERRAPHVVDHLVSRRLVPTGGGSRRLTVDLELQESLEERVRLHLREIERFGATQAGVVVLDNVTGDVLAMVGSRRYGEVAVSGAVNAATAPRTPGSTLKPFVYALAIADGAHPSTLVYDVPTHLAGYQPRNPSDHHQGAVPLREALGSSLNVPAVRTAAQVGPERVATLLHDAGLRSLDPRGQFGLSIALGGVTVPLVELADAYAMLARGGLALPHRYLADAPQPNPRRVLSEDVAFLVTDALADPTARRREFGFETPLDLPFPVAAKTGTSQAYCDNVVVGYTPELTVAAWVGNFDGRPLRGLLAMDGAAPLWRAAMIRAMTGRPPRAFAPPRSVARATICGDDGLLAGPGCATPRLEYVAEARGGAGPLIGALTGGVARDTHLRTAPAGALRIVAPPAGATFVIDPLLPRARQRVALRAVAGTVGLVRWSVNGAPLTETDAAHAAHLTLEPGHLRLRAELVGDEARFDEIEIEVKG